MIIDMSQNFTLELPQLLERMHRRYLDVVRLGLMRVGIRDINPVQVMMLATIGQSDDMSVRDLIERGYYLGSNASYNIKNLSDGGYIDRLTDVHDRRAARVKLTDKGEKVLMHLKEIDEQISRALLADDKSHADHKTTLGFLRRFERECSLRVSG
jgi:DNA-binding MarR family transcriptional regulator